MEKMYFDEPQPKVQISNKKALVLLNETKEEEERIVPTEDGKEETEQFVQYAYDGEWIHCTKEKDILDACKAKVIEGIANYDDSPAVNTFYLADTAITWGSKKPNSPQKAVRMGLRQNIADAITDGTEAMEIWLNGKAFTFAPQVANDLMRQVENYAYACYNVTAQHKETVQGLATIEEVLEYDYTTGYPSKLRFEYKEE